MAKTRSVVFFTYLIFSYLTLANCAPRPHDGLEDDDDGDDESNSINEIIPNFFHQSMDYNSVVGHFKDFFMYLPVMFTTLKETMSGFPKFAEGLNILTAGMSGAPPKSKDENDCHCNPSPKHTHSEPTNDIDGAEQYK